MTASLDINDKIYNPKEIEQKLYQQWEQKGYFAPNASSDTFCIILPPPNVTGSLHMGHGFGYTLIDILIRYQRMCGKATLWQGGTDHAGIATQMVVERKVQAEGSSRLTLGRDAFEKKIWEWKEESGGNITRQLRRLGASIDWNREKFTLDPESSFAVREVFIKLYEEGLIYKGTRLVNWDPSLLTAISDLEVISEEVAGSLWHINYPLATPSSELKFITVATTRPETMLGDVAVAVHPEDERYKNFIGQYLKLPLTDRKIPIIADEYVDPTFGTGCVKITPAHDFNDYEIGLRHQLSPINILTPTAHLNENTPEKYRGLERFKARAQIISDLESLGLLAKIETHVSKIPRGEKSNAIIEPMLTPQWFMKMESLAKPAIAAVENGDIKFVPENWNKTYFQWMNNIQDWCISRQLWWGHRIPVWYDEQDKIYVGHDEAAVREKYQLADSIILRQEQDVLDTWFSAGLWPFSSLGWPTNPGDFEKFFPTQVLMTGFDIIFFWVARMIMLSLKFTGQVPFREVYITGLIKDSEGKKMSKSKGNVLDPIDLIDGISLDDLIQKRTYGLMQPAMAEKITKATRKEYPDGITNYGTDALRFTFCSLATFTREIRFDTNRLAGNRNFCNKLWNASRYISMNTEGYTYDANREIEFSLADQWIKSKLQICIEEAHKALNNYRFDFYAQTLYDFIWNEFCDWYIELSKPTLFNADSSEKLLAGTKATLVFVFENILRLLHPIMPFITEELWQKIKIQAGCVGDTIMLQPFPIVDSNMIDAEIVNDVDKIKQIISAIRIVRSEMNISPAKALPILLRNGNDYDQAIIAKHSPLLKTLAKLGTIGCIASQENPPPSASTFVNDLEIYIPMSGFINKAEEEARLNREISKCEKEFLSISTKLENPTFKEKAPGAVVEKEMLRQAELSVTLEKLKAQIESLKTIDMQK